jgi:integrase
MTARRSYGTGRVFVRTDRNGRETFYGSWWANGRRVKRSLGPKRQAGARDGLTTAQAEARLRELMAEVETPGPVKGDALTITELGRRYVENLERLGRKKSTRTAVESVLRVWLVPFLGDRDLRRLRVEDVTELVRRMEKGERAGPRQRGDRRYGRPTAPKTVRNAVGVLAALLAFGERKDWGVTNVARRVDLPRTAPRDDIRFLDPVEVRALADAAQEGTYQAIDRALYITAAMTGLRQGELCALRWRDVDWTAGRVRVRQNYVLGEFGTPKSKRSTRSVPMADEVAAELDRLTAGGEPAPDELVFADPFTGGPLNKAAILRRFRKALKAAKLPETHRFHDLRHTFGTRMAAAGAPMRSLQEWLGHRDLATTAIYADYAASAHEAAFVADAFAVEPIGGSVRGSKLSGSQRTPEHLSPANPGA